MQDGDGAAVFTDWGSSAMGGTRHVVVHPVAAADRAGQRVALYGVPLFDVDRDRLWRRENADFACGRCVAALDG